jgi:hypothetical protein
VWREFYVLDQQRLILRVSRVVTQDCFSFGLVDANGGLLACLRWNYVGTCISVLPPNIPFTFSILFSVIKKLAGNQSGVLTSPVFDCA